MQVKVLATRILESENQKFPHHVPTCSYDLESFSKDLGFLVACLVGLLTGSLGICSKGVVLYWLCHYGYMGDYSNPSSFGSNFPFATYRHSSLLMVMTIVTWQKPVPLGIIQQMTTIDFVGMRTTHF